MRVDSEYVNLIEPKASVNDVKLTKTMEWYKLTFTTESQYKTKLGIEVLF